MLKKSVVVLLFRTQLVCGRTILKPISRGSEMNLHEAFQQDVLKSSSFLEALNAHYGYLLVGQKKLPTKLTVTVLKCALHG